MKSEEIAVRRKQDKAGRVPLSRLAQTITHAATATSQAGICGLQLVHVFETGFTTDRYDRAVCTPFGNVVGLGFSAKAELIARAARYSQVQETT